MSPEKKRSRKERRHERDAAAETDLPVENGGCPHDDRLSLRDYVMFNVVFDAFCFFQMVIVYFFLKEAMGMFFFFGMTMVGFFLVSMFDYLYDRLSADGPEEGRAEVV